MQPMTVSASDHIEIHTRLGNDYRNWKHTAQELFAGSTILTRERERVEKGLQSGKAPIEVLTLWIELMLAAFGIECLIKAIWLKQGNTLARDGKYIGMGKKEPYHQLVKLCDLAGITLDPREADALQEISDIATSLGQYPIAKRVENERRSVSWPSVVIEI
jgi:hypothetical protein